MRIISWNCNGALRKKFHALEDFKADIHIIQECEDPLEASDKNYLQWSKNHIWTGSTKNKGIGIFAKPELRIELLNWSNIFIDHPVKHFLPCTINNQFKLLGVWTHRNNSPNFGYIGQFWKYLQVNKSLMENIIIAGDFNSNKIWDQWDRWWNHSDVVKELESIEIQSLYHLANNENQGEESQTTLFLQKNLNKKYHIDYIFASRFFREKFKEIKIGDFSEWLKLSDHMPIICDFDL